ncbi:MAG: endonuclease III domain-containing protein [Actinomycetota bacterium]
MRAVHRRLERSQGTFTPKPRGSALEGLVGTVLSQNTSDVNSGRAFASLKSRFRSWAEALEAPADELADAIRSGGIAEVKSRRIQAILAEVERREGRLDLSRMDELPDEEVDEYLSTLPGVGPKTVACVLLFSMGRHAFPIDTHVHRVTTRLGWIPPRTSAQGAHRILSPRVPPEIRYGLHIMLVRHGRAVCKPKMPLCSECVLFDLCQQGPRLVGAGAAR